MLYICIPVFNEAPTVGLVLWKLRKVLQDSPREFEVVIYDDGSTDGTRDTLAPYADVLPLTIIGPSARQGYARALDALARHVTTATRYPRRDAMIVLQGDLTDQPDDIPEMVKRFDGGADIVVAERAMESPMPLPVRRLRTWSAWLSKPGALRIRTKTLVYRKPFLSIAGVADPFGAGRLYRISVLRDMVKARGQQRLVENEGWAGNAELLLRASAHARRVETITVAQRFDLRPRESRVRPWADGRALYSFSRIASSIATPRAAASQRRD